jgi:hypothetical protein
MREEKMRTFFHISVFAMSFILMVCFGSHSCAQDAAGEKPVASEKPAAPEKPAEQASQEKPATKTIPADFTANLNTTFFSKYVWRGLELSKDSLVIFPSLTIGYKGFALNVWVDLDTEFNNPPPGKKSKANLQETDLTLTYTNKIKPLKMDYTLGWIYYDTDGFYGDSSTSNQEVFVTLAFDFPLKPTLSVYREIETGAAWYTSLALSHSFKIYKEWTWDMGGWISYIYNKSTEDISAMDDGNIWMGLTIPVNSHFSIIPKIQYSFPLSSAARKRIEANSFNGQDSNFLYGGLIFDLKF